jgi:uncharacterized damage-inducible protein DinB
VQLGEGRACAPFAFSSHKDRTLTQEEIMSQQPAFTPEFALAYRALMLDGLAREAEITKKIIAAVPDAASSYKPDPNARTARELAWHLANTDVQFLDGIGDLKFTFASPERKPETSAEVVAWYDERIKRASARVAALTAEQLLTPINFYMFNLPAVLYFGFLNNHSIHHRGELATYLRPMGSKVPSIYGGSYDEPLQPPAQDETAA